MKGSTLRAGLVGLGAMGRNHCRNLMALSGVDLVCVADPAGDKAGVLRNTPTVESVEQLLEYELDYCVVAAPTSNHAEIATQLVEAGVHMLVEKPVASDVESGREMVEAFNRAGLIGAVGHIERYNAALQQMKARLEEGELGEIYQIATCRQGPFPSRIADVGVVLDLASHDIDLTGFVTGRKYKAISARAAHKTGRTHEDLIAATGILEGNIIANHLVNWLSPQKTRSVVLTGERGTFVASTLTADLTYYANGTVDSGWEEVAHFRGMTEGDVIRYAFPKLEPLRVEHEAFRDAVLGDDARIVPLEDGLAALNVCAAILESTRSGEVVEIQS